MAIEHDEKVIAYALKDPRVPVGTVEGKFHGERAVFLCLIDQDDLTKKVDITPVAMLVREDDIKHITRETEEVNQIGGVRLNHDNGPLIIKP